MSRTSSREAARSRRFLLDAGVLQAGTLVVAAGHLTSSIVLASWLGPESQGTYYTALAFFGVLYLLGSLGFATATVGRVAASDAQDDAEAVAVSLGALARVWLTIGLCALPLGALVLPPVADLLLAEPGVGALAGWLCATPLLEVPRTVVRAALEGTRRMMLVSVLDGGIELLRVTCVCAAVLWDASPFAAVAGHIVATGLGAVLAAVVYRRARASSPALPGLGALTRAAKRATLRAHARLGMELGLSRFSRGLVVELLPPLLLTRFAGPAWTAYYRIAQRLLSLPFLATQSVGRVSLPALSEHAARGEWTELRTAYRRITVVTGLVRCGAFAVWIPLLPFVTDALYPEGYSDAVWLLASISLPGLVALAFTAPLETFYVATSSVRTSLAINACLGGVTAVLLFVLSPLWGHVGTVCALSIGGVCSLAHHVHVGRALRRLSCDPVSAAS